MRWGVAIGILLLLAGLPGTGFAQDQTLQLRPGWNLISLSVEPVSAAASDILDIADTDGTYGLSNPASFQELWAYDATTDVWLPYSPPVTLPAEITSLAVGVGYWLKVSATGTLVVEGIPNTPAPGTLNLVEEWNLVGTATLEPKRYDTVFRVQSGVTTILHPDLREIWTYDELDQRFLGVILDAQGDPIQEDFTEMEAGKGYWAYFETPLTNMTLLFEPTLATSFPGDIDVDPLDPDNNSEVDSCDPRRADDARLLRQPRMGSKLWRRRHSDGRGLRPSGYAACRHPAGQPHRARLRPLQPDPGRSPELERRGRRRGGHRPCS